VRHIGFELRFGLRHELVAIDVWFWRAASFQIWEAAKQAPEAYNTLAGASWVFSRIEEKPRGCMSLVYKASVREASTWPELYGWFGENLLLLFERIAPRLRDDLEKAIPSGS
jgi:hypothetical protein